MTDWSVIAIESRKVEAPMPSKPGGKASPAPPAKRLRKPAPRARTNAPQAPARRRADAASADARREAILAAALDVFSQRGFATARLDDVAAKAGIAKGTLYLYFKSKEALFEELIRSRVTPIFDNLEHIAAAVPPDVLIARFFELFRTEVLGTERQLILQLLISEGPHFPAIAEFYYREVVSRGLKLIRGVLRRAPSANALPTETLERYPQLIVAPLIVSVVWDRLFGRIDPLDVEGMLAAHTELLAAAGKAQP
jgi:AcrR family transcriptional regulator